MSPLIDSLHACVNAHLVFTLLFASLCIENNKKSLQGKLNPRNVETVCYTHPSLETLH